MKRLIYQVYTGKRSKLYDYCTTSVATYAVDHDVDYVVQNNPIMKIKPDVFVDHFSSGFRGIPVSYPYISRI